MTADEVTNKLLIHTTKMQQQIDDHLREYGKSAARVHKALDSIYSKLNDLERSFHGRWWKVGIGVTGLLTTSVVGLIAYIFINHH